VLALGLGHGHGQSRPPQSWQVASILLTVDPVIQTFRHVLRSRQPRPGPTPQRGARQKVSIASGRPSRSLGRIGLATALVVLHEGVTQSILREVWQGIPGVQVADLTAATDFPDRPATTGSITDFFEAPSDAGDNYGQRLHGYVRPPVTGAYTFWIACDDGGELWLSTDSDPSNRRLIAAVTSWTSAREWTRERGQQSSPIHLEEGRPYYVAALHKEGGAGDNLAVRWLRPDGIDEGPIPAQHLIPFGEALTPPIITLQPTNSAAIEGDYATFSVQVSNLDPVSVRWQRNAADLPAAGRVRATARSGSAMIKCVFVR